MRNIGIDLHKTMFVVCILEGENKEFRQYSIKEIDSFVETLQADDAIAVESTGNSRYFTQQVKSKTSKIVVVNPSRFKVISQSAKKTDKNDAELIAIYLQKELLPSTRMTEDYSSQLKSLISTRDKLVKSRSVMKNKIHSILNFHGILTKQKDYSSVKGLKRVLDYKLDELVKLELEILVDEIMHLNENIGKLEKTINSMGSQMKGYENITSIKGVAAQSASTLLSIIGDINDFENEKKLAAYFGLVPYVSQSNESLHQGRITKRGTKIGRTTLVQCTLVAKKYSPYLNDFYERIKNKRGSGKAIIATARKLLSIIYHTLKNNWVFEDFPNFILKQV